MAQTNINIRIDEDVKKQAEVVFNELGMNMSTAVNIFIKKAIRAQGIPFDLTIDDDFYNAYNMKVLKSRLDDMNNGENIVVKDLVEGADENNMA